MLALKANDERSAQMGELTTTALAAQGCRGVVTDGGLRDTEFVLEQGFPVASHHRTPADSICFVGSLAGSSFRGFHKCIHWWETAILRRFLRISN